MNCLICRDYLEDLSKHQPSGGTAFHTEGHYGSTVTDHMDGTVTIVFVCDSCLKEALFEKIALEIKPYD